MELNWNPFLPHRSRAGRDVICMVKNIQVPGTSGLERALEFVLPEMFVVLRVKGAREKLSVRQDHGV